MKRRLVQLAVAASFVLCLAVHLVWLRSYFYSETVHWKNAGGWRAVRTAAGHLEVSLLLVDWSAQPAKQFYGPKYERGQVRPPFNTLLLHCHSVGDQRINWERGGLAWHSILNFKHGQHNLILVAPCWFLAAATALLPVATTTRRIWRRGARAGG